jgi:hypothetical protein
MEKMTIGKAISILFEVIMNYKLSLIILLFLGLLVYLFISTKKKDIKTTRKVYLMIYIVVLLLIVVLNYNNIYSFFDYMMNNLFIAIYFPNLAIYFAALIVSNIIVLISIFSNNISRVIRNINIVVYTLITYILILLINVISVNKLDIYSRESIYKNINAYGLIELTSIIFLFWIIFLIIYGIIRKYQINNKEKQEVIARKVIYKEKEKRKLPSNIVRINPPRLAHQENINIKLDEKEIENLTNKEVQRRVNIIMKESHELDNFLTKRDYINILKILKKEIINKKEKVVIDDQSSYQRIQKLYENIK